SFTQRRKGEKKRAAETPWRPSLRLCVKLLWLTQSIPSHSDYKTERRGLSAQSRKSDSCDRLSNLRRTKNRNPSLLHSPRRTFRNGPATEEHSRPLCARYDLRLSSTRLL